MTMKKVLFPLAVALLVFTLFAAGDALNLKRINRAPTAHPASVDKDADDDDVADEANDEGDVTPDEDNEHEHMPAHLRRENLRALHTDLRKQFCSMRPHDPRCHAKDAEDGESDEGDADLSEADDAEEDVDEDGEDGDKNCDEDQPHHLRREGDCRGGSPKKKRKAPAPKLYSPETQYRYLKCKQCHRKLVRERNMMRRYGRCPKTVPCYARSCMRIPYIPAPPPNNNPQEYDPPVPEAPPIPGQYYPHYRPPKCCACHRKPVVVVFHYPDRCTYAHCDWAHAFPRRPLQSPDWD